MFEVAEQNPPLLQWPLPNICLCFQKWIQATNIRLRMLQTKTMLGDLMSVAQGDSTVTRRVSQYQNLLM